MDIDKKINKSIKFLQKYTKKNKFSKTILILFMFFYYIAKINTILNLT